MPANQAHCHRLVGRLLVLFAHWDGGVLVDNQHVFLVHRVRTGHPMAANPARLVLSRTRAALQASHPVNPVNLVAMPTLPVPRLVHCAHWVFTGLCLGQHRSLRVHRVRLALTALPVGPPPRSLLVGRALRVQSASSLAYLH